jgi:hypothetical protein
MKLIQRILARKSENGRKSKGVKLYTLSALIILLSLVTSSAQGAAPLPSPNTTNAVDAVWNIQIIDGTPAGLPPFPLSLRFMTDRSLAVKSDNTPCVAFGGDYLFYSCWNTVAQKWDTEVVDGSYLVGSYAALAFDFSSRPFISYYDAANGNLKLAYNLGSGWEILVVDSNPLPYAISGTILSTPDDVASPELKALHKLEDSLFGNNQLIDASQQKDMISQVEASIGVGKHTSIALDTYGSVHISYYDEANRDLKYAFWERFYGPLSWTIETVDAYSDQGVVGTYTSIAVDQSNRPHIAYMSEKYDDLKYARRSSSGSWQIFDVDKDQNVGSYASLALQEIGNSVYPHISYLDFTSYNLKYAYVGSDSQWKKQAVDSQGVVGLYISIARGSDGRVWISYYDQTNGDLKYASISGSTTTVKTIYKDGNIGFYTSIALNKSNNKPGIVFGDFTNNSLNYTYLNADNQWIASVVNFVSSVESKVGLNTSLSINGFGEPVISYRDANAGALKFARYFPPIWKVEFVNPNISDGQHSSTAWIDDYRPAIAFYEQVQGDLVYAKWNLVSHSWVFEKIDTTGDVGRYVSLAIDSGGNPHMSYYDATYGNLKYAYWDSVSNSWKIVIVDPVGDVGYFTSLTLDESDRPYVSYYDKTNERIKYAYKNLGDSWESYPLVKVGIDGDGVVVSDAFTSVSIFDNGIQRFMRIAYYNDTQKDLMLAVANVEFPSSIVDWTISAIDSPGSVGKFVSMSIEKGTDNRHLCYFDESNGDLKYALWNGAWSLEIVESAGYVGQYCSIALNNVGEPAVSYYDASLGKLKYATTFDMPLARLYIPIVEKE